MLAVLLPAPPAYGADAEFVFADPLGDTTSSLDIGEVAVEWTAGGPLVLDVELGGIEDTFPVDTRVEVSIDIDFDGRGDLLVHVGAEPFGEPRMCRPSAPGSFGCSTSPELEASLSAGRLAIELTGDPLLSDPEPVDQFQLRVVGIDGYPSLVSADVAGPWAVYVTDSEPPEIILAFEPVTVWATGPDGTSLNYFTFVRADDLIDPNPSLSCSPPSGSVLPIGENLVTCVASDAAGNTASRSFTVHVLGAEDILDYVIGFIEESSAPAATGLANILETSILHLDQGRNRVACRILGAFSRAGGHLAEKDDSGVQMWWVNSVDHVADDVLECGIG